MRKNYPDRYSLMSWRESFQEELEVVSTHMYYQDAKDMATILLMELDHIAIVDHYLQRSIWQDGKPLLD